MERRDVTSARFMDITRRSCPMLPGQTTATRQSGKAGLRAAEQILRDRVHVEPVARHCALASSPSAVAQEPLYAIADEVLVAGDSERVTHVVEGEGHHLGCRPRLRRPRIEQCAGEAETASHESTCA